MADIALFLAGYQLTQKHRKEHLLSLSEQTKTYSDGVVPFYKELLFVVLSLW